MPLMFVERSEMGETTSQERRDSAQPDSRVLGRVIQCDGARATLAAFACDEQAHVLGMWTVGRMISINLGTIRTVGLVYRIETPVPAWDEAGQNPISVHVELVGEVRDGEAGKPVFDRGITVLYGLPVAVTTPMNPPIISTNSETSMARATYSTGS